MEMEKCYIISQAASIIPYFHTEGNLWVTLPSDLSGCILRVLKILFPLVNLVMKEFDDSPG